MRFKIVIAAVTVIFFSACVKRVSLNLRTPAAQLVVEGLLLTDSTPCSVTLSYSGIFNSQGGQTQNFINDATVYLKDSLGNSTQLINVGNGTYTNPNYISVVAGGTYWLAISLSNGKKYASFPETIAGVPKDIALDSIGEIQSTNPAFSGLWAADVQIKTQDPANEKNYYRWINTEYISRQSSGVPCSLGSTTLCDEYCFQYYPHDTTIRILSDAYINGQLIRGQTALLSPYFSIGTYYVLIKQLSLTPQAYGFWQLYQQQTGRTGSILDPLPASLQGNIYNVNDNTDVALGYFEASDAASLRLILSPIFINAYYTFNQAGAYRATGACADAYTNASYYAPPGWQNAQQIIYDVY